MMRNLASWHILWELLSCLLCALEAGDRPASVASVDLPGQRADGSVLLPNQWSLRPVGRQVTLGDFPVNIAVHPGGLYAAILHCGHGDHEIATVDLATAKTVSRVRVPEAFYGLAFAADGSQLFCSGAGDEVVHAFAFRDGYLGEHSECRVRPAAERGVPGGLAVSRDGTQLWVASVWGHRLTGLEVNTGNRICDIALGEQLAANAALLQPPVDPDLAAATKRDEAQADPTTPTSPFPYACVLDEPRQRLYRQPLGSGPRRPV